MNQVWAWLVTGLVTGVLAPAVVLALRPLRWRPPRPPAPATGAGFVVVHGTITVSLVAGFAPPVWAALHVVLLAAGVVYLLPVLDNRGRMEGSSRFAYTFLTAPLLDFAGAVVVALGHSEGGVAMIAGMLPLNALAVVLAWRWLADEERAADALLAADEAG